MNMKKSASLALTLVLGFLGSSANAVGWKSCGESGNIIKWDTNNVTLKAGNMSFPTAGAFTSSLQTAVDRINSNPSKFRFSLAFGDSSVAIDNDENEIWFTTDQELLAGAPARTLSWNYCFWAFGWHYDLLEADVIFDSNIAYTASMNKLEHSEFGGNKRPFQTTAIHELAHAAGLGHENRWYSIMGSDWNHIHVNGSTARSYLGEDGAEGTVILYGASGSFYEDLSVSNFTRVGASGEYSRHDFNLIKNAAGVALSLVPGTGVTPTKKTEPRYIVSKGQSIKFDYTVENNGKSAHTPNVAFYLSNNSTITTADILLGTTSFAVTRNQPTVKTANLVVPANLVSGSDYYIGVIIDYDNKIEENVSSNNATYLPIRIQ